MASWKLSKEDPIYRFKIGCNSLEIQEKCIDVSLFFIPGIHEGLYYIDLRYKGKLIEGNYYYKKNCANKYYGDWDGLFINCLINNGIDIFSWKNVEYYKKILFEKDKKSKFRYRKYINAKKQFESYLKNIHWKKCFYKNLWEHKMKNIEKKRLKDI